MKKLVSLILVVAMAITMLACSGKTEQTTTTQPAAQTQADAPKQETPAVKPMDINFGAGAMGGTYYTVASTIKTVVEENCPSVKSVTVMTGGSNQFTNECQFDGTVDVFMNTLDALNYAYSGAGKQGFEAGVKYDKLNVLSLMYGMPLMLITLESNPIATAAEVKGKVGVGSATLQGPTTDLLKAAGVANPDVAVINDYNQLNQGLIDGTYEAVIHTGPAPQAYTLSLISFAKVKILPLGEGAAKRAVEAGGDASFCQIVTVAKGAYEFVVEDYETIARTASITCSEELPEQVVYEIVKAIYEHGDAITAVVPFSEMNKEGMQAVADSGLLNMPVHPGARKYYEEIGIVFPASVPVK